MGAKRWFRVSMEAGYLADSLAAGIWALWEVKMGAIWAFLGRQVGPFWGPKWVRRALWGTNLAKEKKRPLRGAFRRVP